MLALLKRSSAPIACLRVLRICSLASSSSGGGSSRPSASTRQYPGHPRVGIGVILLRRVQEKTQVLLIRRGRDPEKGMLSYPGGSLELGETMIECAARETYEETQLKLRNKPSEGPLLPRSLSCPRPVDAVDAIHIDSQGRVEFHYTIVDLAALPEDPHATPVASDDAEEVIWKDVQELRGMQDLAKDTARITEEAIARFDIPEG